MTEQDKVLRNLMAGVGRFNEEEINKVDELLEEGKLFNEARLKLEDLANNHNDWEAQRMLSILYRIMDYTEGELKMLDKSREQPSFYEFGNMYTDFELGIYNVQKIFKSLDVAVSKNDTEAIAYSSNIFNKGLFISRNTSYAKEFAYSIDKDSEYAYFLAQFIIFNGKDFNEFQNLSHMFDVVAQKSSKKYIKIKAAKLKNLSASFVNDKVKKENVTVYEWDEILDILNSDKKEGVYYRGQTKEYDKPLKPSMFRYMEYSSFPIFYEGPERIRKAGNLFYLEHPATRKLSDWRFDPRKHNYILSYILHETMKRIYCYPIAASICQQAGYRSEAIDITFDPTIALFFATHKYNTEKSKYELLEDDEVSVIYKWKNLKKMNKDNILKVVTVNCPSVIPTYEIFDTFEKIDTGTREQQIEIFKKSLEDWMNILYKLDSGEILEQDVNIFKTIKIPNFLWERSRIYMQKAALLLPDRVFCEGAANAFLNRGIECPYMEDIPFQMYQDVTEDNYCEKIYFKRNYEKMKSFFGPKQKNIIPDLIYDDSENTVLDIVHYMTRTEVLETYMSQFPEVYRYFSEFVPIPQFGYSYANVLEELEHERGLRNKDRYYLA